MRVWRINQFDWIAGPTILSAVRGACKEAGVAAWELIDREYFGEVPSSDWDNIGCYDPDMPGDIDGTLSGAVATLDKPGIIMRTEH